MKKEHFLQSEGFKTVAASVLSILIGLAVGSIVILIVGLTSPNLSLSSAWDGIRIVFGGLFSTGRDASGTLMWGFNPTNIGNMLFRAAPLIMTGLSVGMAYKTGLFNIGAPGQYLIGTLVSLSIALGLPSETMSTTLIWLLAFLGGTLAGAIWGAIPGLFKALLNINEVLACIMTNWIAANLVTWLFDISNFKNVTESTKTGYIYKTTYNGVATAKMGLDKLFPNSQVNGGILIAIVFAIAVYVMMSKTTFGYQLKACGSNRHAARYAGIADKRNIVISMAIAGGLSAAGASLYYLSGNTEFFWSTYQSLPAIGFNGIPVAMLASCNPIGIIFAALFMSMLDISGLQLTNLTAYNEYITNVIIAVIVYLSAFSLVIKMWIGKLGKRRTTARMPTRSPHRRQLPHQPVHKRKRRKEATRNDIPHSADAHLCRPSDDRGACGRVRRAQRYHQPGARRYHGLRRVHRRLVCAHFADERRHPLPQAERQLGRATGRGAPHDAGRGGLRRAVLAAFELCVHQSAR